MDYLTDSVWDSNSNDNINRWANFIKYQNLILLRAAICMGKKKTMNKFISSFFFSFSLICPFTNLLLVRFCSALISRGWVCIIWLILISFVQVPLPPQPSIRSRTSIGKRCVKMLQPNIQRSYFLSGKPYTIRQAGWIRQTPKKARNFQCWHISAGAWVYFCKAGRRNRSQMQPMKCNTAPR